MTVRAKFLCAGVSMQTSGPVKSTRYVDGKSTDTMVWPRTYTLTATYDPSVPEDQWYSAATPYGKVEIKIDNSAASFELGQQYYLDFIPVPAPEPAA